MGTDWSRGGWESAFESCPPYGDGRAPYEQQDTAVLADLERCAEQLLACAHTENTGILRQYLECQREYTRRCCRYYFYRGMLHGTREALDAWAEDCGP